MRARDAALAIGMVVSVGIGGRALAVDTDADHGVSRSMVEVADRLEAAIDVAGSPDWPLEAFGSIWVLAPDLPITEGRGTPNLVRVDPATNEVTATIALADRLCQGIVDTDDAVWACAVDGMVRVDPTTDSIVSTVPLVGVQKAYRPAWGDGRLWLLSATSFVGDTVISLDPTTETTMSYALDDPAGGLVHAFDALWMTVPSTGSVARLDSATGQVDVVVRGLPSPNQITAGAGSIWVTLFGGEDRAAAEDPQVARIDPVTGDVVAEIAVGGFPQGGVDVSVSDERVLIRSTTPWLTVLDPITGAVVETIVDGPDGSASQGPITQAFGSSWTVNLEEDRLLRLAQAPTR
jgi:streptogramin lyase